MDILSRKSGICSKDSRQVLYPDGAVSGALAITAVKDRSIYEYALETRVTAI